MRIHTNGFRIDGRGRPARVGKLVGGAFVRLLDSSDEFAAEVVTSCGYFRIFAAPGSWTVRASTIIGSRDAAITIESPGIHEVDIKIATWTAGS